MRAFLLAAALVAASAAAPLPALANLPAQPGAADGALSVAVVYRGILPPLITTGAARALYFGIFENAKRVLEPGVAEDELSLRSVGVAAAATRAVAAAVTARVVAQNAEPFEGGQMVIPIPVIAGKTVVQADDRRTFRSGQPVVQFDFAHANAAFTHTDNSSCR